MDWGYGMGMGGAMMFVWVVIAFVLIGMIIWALSRAAATQQTRGRDAGEILRERYARGEITREQFDQMRDDLRR